MDHVEFESRPEVSRPIMVCAFAGWNDAGEAATTALRYVGDHWDAERFARIDPEEFFDFQVNRPTVRLEDGQTRRLDWPACEFSHAHTQGKDLVLLLGVEPNIRWRTFAEEIVGVAGDLGVEFLVTVGAFLADVPHTLPAPLTAASTDPHRIGRLGVTPSLYEGPTGIVGVLHDVARRAGLSSVSLWAAAPHYLPAEKNPKVALALVRKLGELVGVDVDTGEVSAEAADWELKVGTAVDEDENLASYVKRLEAFASEGADPGEIPSGDQLAEELERFLREQSGDVEG